MMKQRTVLFCAIMGMGGLAFWAQQSNHLEQRNHHLAFLTPHDAHLTLQLSKDTLFKALGERWMEDLKLGESSCIVSIAQQLDAFQLIVRGDDWVLVLPGSTLRHTDVRECVAAAIRLRNGQLKRIPYSSYELLTDKGGRRGTIASRDGGPLVWGDGRLLKDTLHTIEKRRASLGTWAFRQFSVIPKHSDILWADGPWLSGTLNQAVESPLIGWLSVVGDLAHVQAHWPCRKTCDELAVFLGSWRDNARLSERSILPLRSAIHEASIRREYGAISVQGKIPIKQVFAFFIELFWAPRP